MPRMYHSECCSGGVEVEDRQCKAFEEAGWTTDAPKVEEESDAPAPTPAQKKAAAAKAAKEGNK